jgi:hypothetical protein
MNTNQSTQTSNTRIVWTATALAIFTSIAYVLIALGILPVGNPQVASDGGPIIYVAAGCYIVGGLLILVRRQWLWIIGVVINALVVLFYFMMYQARPEVLFSAGGLATKIPQLLLEVVLLYLIISGWIKNRKASTK